MHAEEIREFALQKKCSSEGFPFDNNTLVLKVCDKMFLLLSLDQEPLRINIKCEPLKAIQLREQYTSVLPGYHMNKKHWNTVLVDGSVPRKILLSWIEDSYLLVANSLPAKDRIKIGI